MAGQATTAKDHLGRQAGEVEAVGDGDEVAVVPSQLLDRLEGVPEAAAGELVEG